MRKLGGRPRLEGREQNGDVSPQISLCLVIADAVVVLGGGGHWVGTGRVHKAIVPAWQPCLAATHLAWFQYLPLL